MNSSRSVNKVADMISVFDKESSSSGDKPSVQRGKYIKQTTDATQPIIESTKPSPQPSDNTKIPFKIIHVSGSGQVVDEKNPSISKTIGHFKATGINNYNRQQHATNKGPAIKPMGFQPRSYATTTSNRKISAPPTIRQNSTLPRSKTYEDKLSSNSTPLLSPSPPSRPLSQFFAEEEDKKQDDDNSSQPTSPVKSIKEAGGIWFTNNSTSVPSTPSKIPTVRTWDKIGTTKPSSVKRSKSFTSRVSVEVSTGRRDQRKNHRSSIALDFGVTPKDVIQSEERARSAMAGALCDEEKENGEYSPSIPLKKFLSDVKYQEKKTVLSTPISVEVNRIVSTFSTDDKDTPTTRRGSFQYKTLPSRLNGEHKSQPATSPKDKRSTAPAISPKVKRSTEPATSPKVKRSTEPAISPKVKRSTEPATSPKVKRSTEPATSPKVKRLTEQSTSPKVKRSSEPAISPKVKRSTEHFSSKVNNTSQGVRNSSTSNVSLLREKKESPKVPPKFSKGKVSNFTTQRSLDSCEQLNHSLSPTLTRATLRNYSPKGSPVSSPSMKRSSPNKKHSPPLQTGSIKSKIALFQSGAVPSNTQSSTLPRRTTSSSPHLSAMRLSPQLSVKESVRNRQSKNTTTTTVDSSNNNNTTSVTTTNTNNTTNVTTTNTINTTTNTNDTTTNATANVSNDACTNSKEKDENISNEEGTTPVIDYTKNESKEKSIQSSKTNLATATISTATTSHEVNNSSEANNSNSQDLTQTDYSKNEYLSKSNKRQSKVPPTPLPKPQRPHSIAAPPINRDTPPTHLNEPKVEEEERSSQTRLRIHSEKDENSNHDNEIKVEIFEPQLRLLSSVQDTPTINNQDTPTIAVENSQSCDQDTEDTIFHHKQPDSEETTPTRSSRYSYQEYTLMRKSLTRSSASTSSICSDTTNKSLAVIPENSQSLSIYLEDNKEEKEEEEEQSEDSESELVQRMSHVSGTFYEEVFDSIASKLVQSEGEGGASEMDERVNEVKKRLSQVVDNMVRNDPELEADGLYESLEEYGRRVSDYLHHKNDEETPPELPPRPDFLLKLIKEDDEQEIELPFILQDYETVGMINEERNENYEIVSDNQENVKSPSKKKLRRNSKSPFKRKNIDETRSISPPLSFSQEGNFAKSNKKQNKKKWKIPGRSVKIEPTSSLPSIRSTSVSEGIKSLIMTPLVTPPPPHMYVNVGGRSASVSGHKLHSSSYESVDMIPPTYSSESEGEEMGGVCDSIINSTNSPTKIRWKDELPRTPDSSVFSVEDRYSHTQNPMTPPLTTKLSINTTTPTRQYLRTSTSDPSLFSTSLHLTTISHRIHPHLSPTPSPCGELSLDSIDMNSTPSVCSYDSNRYLERSPAVMRKRVCSDASDDRMARRGAHQKAKLLLATQVKKRRGSLPGSNSSTEGVIEVPLVYADALMDCRGMEPDHLSFKVNDVISVLDMRHDDWWQGIVEDRIGWFSASWVRLRINQEGGDNSSLDHESDYITDQSSSTSSSFRLPKSESLPDTLDNIIKPPIDDLNTTICTDASNIPNTDDTTEQDTVPELNHIESKANNQHSVVTRRRTIRKRDSGDLPRSLSPAEIRAKCIEEILHTERAYVNHLQNIIEGFLHQCRQRSSLFDEERIETIFCNIEDIYKFQQEFLKLLESRIVPGSPGDSLIGEIFVLMSGSLGDSLIGEMFVLMKDKFAMYSEYCNNHPHAVNEMNTLQQDQQYTLFFEGCRLIRNMTDISLEGFLLNPVQRICRYPLQLSELLKYTPDTHPDYCHVLAAQEAMKQVAILINERKRRMESLGRIKCWQDSVENWKGSDLLERSTELIHGGDLHKISKGHSQERYFFLFDHQLVYCKKDAIGAKLSYKGRVDTDKCEIIDLKDSEQAHGGSGLKNAWKINNVDKDDKWYVLFAKTAQIKQEWMEAFKRERELVKEDESNNFVITPKMKRAAIAMFNASSEPISRKHVTKKNHEWVTESTPVSFGTISRTRHDTVGSSSKTFSYSPVEKKRKYKRK